MLWQQIGAPMSVLASTTALAAQVFDEAWFEAVWTNVRNPWFVFGMTAQFVFFLRFFVQWLASEKKKRSTVPIVFWYISLVGGAMTFIYAVHVAEPVFMLGQLFGCFIYARNLMLIYSHRRRLREEAKAKGEQNAGLEDEPTASEP